ncbi:cytochrome C oxidase subunit IV family protein [Mycolicibacterium psychrotolerans]|uniref:Prokaryotic cytochrome C oxidase subunit IV family protein n=1 Tax=Mycolicibacterium psychrotolerans TaxID=216929 RepID=A0A7I7MBF9_9MYCO|nr:cytochrome C oxidase subunit IV family protein [Mycolicibacterium psychrotolerans]BBX69210.1 prokaryotic cytochrome C oxidase subunit IV family protein [Mycolicibacterium psychrotolerans]
MTTPATSTTRALTVAWLALCAITVISWWLAPGHASGTASASVPLTVTAITLGFVKGRVIVRSFMEVRFAPAWLRRATDGWLVTLWASILVIYLW